MAIPYPKILTRVTVPTGGWDFVFEVDTTGGPGGGSDVTVTGTLAAGDYFVSGDGQSDDLLYELGTKATTALRLEAGFANSSVIPAIDYDTKKVKILFDRVNDTLNNNDVVIKTGTSDEDLMHALGFYTTADESSTDTDDPVFTGDFLHGYAWYAGSDGQLRNLLVEDVSEVRSIQSVSLDGTVKTQKHAEHFKNVLELQHLDRDEMFSDGVAYGDPANHPYDRSKGLECWWQEAQKGVEFRVYRNYRIDTDYAIDAGTATAADTTTLTDSNKSWAIGPRPYIGYLLYNDEFGNNANNDIHQTWYISTHSATVITIPNASIGAYDLDNSSSTYWIFEAPYQTYVVDLQQMTEFAPEEIPGIDKYNITIPMRRFV